MKKEWGYMKDNCIGKKKTHKYDDQFNNTCGFNNWGYNNDCDYSCNSDDCCSNDDCSSTSDSSYCSSSSSACNLNECYNSCDCTDSYDADLGLNGFNDCFEETEAYIDGCIFVPVKCNSCCGKKKFVRRKFKGHICIK